MGDDDRREDTAIVVSSKDSKTARDERRTSVRAADDVDPPADTSRASRSGVVARLAGELAALPAAGDHEGARVINEAISKLLASPQQTSPDERPAAVVLALPGRRPGRW